MPRKPARRALPRTTQTPTIRHVTPQIRRQVQEARAQVNRLVNVTWRVKMMYDVMMRGMRQANTELAKRKRDNAMQMFPYFDPRSDTPEQIHHFMHTNNMAEIETLLESYGRRINQMRWSLSNTMDNIDGWVLQNIEES